MYIHNLLHNLPLEILEIIYRYLDIISLQKIKYLDSDSFCIYKKEMTKRLRSKYPLGEKNAKLIVDTTNDVYLMSIACIVGKNKIQIPKDNYNLPFIRELLRRWFVYKFNDDKWILTAKVTKAVLRLQYKHLNEYCDKFIFAFDIHDNKSYLYDICV